MLLGYIQLGTICVNEMIFVILYASSGAVQQTEQIKQKPYHDLSVNITNYSLTFLTTGTHSLFNYGLHKSQSSHSRLTNHELAQQIEPQTWLIHCSITFSASGDQYADSKTKPI